LIIAPSMASHAQAMPCRASYATRPGAHKATKTSASTHAGNRRWAELLARPERQLNLRLTPGDCLIVDNTRVLHARTAFSVTGGRHLQGCYADLDGLASTLAVLTRGTTPQTPTGIRREEAP